MFNKKSLLHYKFITYFMRFLSNTEVATALRPFYFSVHPDLFGQFPNQRLTNENSLKQLSSFIEALQTKRIAQPCILQFYIRDVKSKQSDQFRLIEINLNRRDVRATVLTLLKSCDLSTEYVDKIPKSLSSVKLNRKTYEAYTKHKENVDFSNLENDTVFGSAFVEQTVEQKKILFTLKHWLNKNYKAAIQLYESNLPLKKEIAKLKKAIAKNLGLIEIRWECGWNEQHFMGCLQSLKDMLEQHPDNMHSLKGRILVFAPFTGVSLDGYIMLSSGEVRHNWLDVGSFCK